MAITTRATILTNKAKGLGYSGAFSGKTTTTITGSAVTSGSLHCQLTFNLVGTTLMSTLVSYPMPPAPPNELFLTDFCYGGSAGNLGGFLARAYYMGTVDFTNTGDRMTVDPNVTYPLTRTVYGAATQAINLVPMIVMTTAMTGTAAQFQLNTTIAGAGYVNQAGNSIVGTKTFVMPSATTTIQSGYILRLEEGDSAVRSVSAVNVTTKSTAGVASVFGLEYLAPGQSVGYKTTVSTIDTVTGCLLMPNLNPAVPTAGTLTSYLVYVPFNTTNYYPEFQIGSVLNV